jgi:photosystem II stability/assembly factor-like uncharacterized protein
MTNPIRRCLFSGLIMLTMFGAMVVNASATWSRVESKTLAWLKAVYFVNENLGWVAGSKGTLLSTDDGGRTWRQTKKFTADNIRDLYFSDARHGWLLCERNVYTSSSKPPSYILQTSDGGSTWQTVELTDSRDRLVRFFFTRDGHGYAVGEGGGIWQMLDDKGSWKRIALPIRYLILSGAFLDDFKGILVGGGGTILLTGDGGVEWTPTKLLEGKISRLNSVFFVDRDKGWIVGNEGKIFITDNGGKIWQEGASGTNEDLSDVFFLDSKAGFAVGDKGTIVQTRTGGATWTKDDSGVNSPLERVFFVGPVGFAVGYGGVILTNRPLPPETPSTDRTASLPYNGS